MVGIIPIQVPPVIPTLPSPGLEVPTLDQIVTMVQKLDSSSISLTSSGLVTTLNGAGTSLDVPTLALSSATQTGQVMFADGTHLITGTESDDTLTGTPGNDAIYALGGNDHVSAGAGHDYVFGGDGGDTIDGGDGNDHLYGGSNVVGPDGADSISGGAGDDYIQGNAGNDVIDAGIGNDRVQGGADDDQISGGAGNDALNGNFGADTIDGGLGNDVVRGGKGDDVVLGGAGDDHVYGDLGADRLTGGVGADTFHFSGNDAAIVSTDTLTGHIDTITDFTVGTDHLAFGSSVTEVIHGAAQGGVADALAYASTLLAGHSAGVVALDVGSDTMLFFNSGGGLVTDSVVALQGVHASSITASAFV